jgi:hypothetical protein
MRDPLTLTLEPEVVDTIPFIELLAVMSPVETIVPVLALFIPLALVPLPAVTVVEVAVTVPVLLLFMP